MSKKITKLSDAQTAMIPKYIEKWINIGINTDRIDYDRTIDIIHDVQEHLLNKPKTPVLIFDNPIEAWVACNFAHNHDVKPNDLPKAVDDYFSGKNKIELDAFCVPYLAGSFDANIFAFYDFFRDEVGISYGDYSKKYDIWKSTSELGLIFPLENVCIVSQKPTKVSLNEARVAHCDGAEAISYAGRGNLNIFMLNGTRVPDWLATTHSTKIDLKKYNEIKNADVKMEFVRKVGIERMLKLGKKLDDYTKYKDKLIKASKYELWDMKNLFVGVDTAPHLKMLNQTTRVWHCEAVSPSCKTITDAINDRLNGRDIEIVKIA